MNQIHTQQQRIWAEKPQEQTRLLLSKQHKRIRTIIFRTRLPSGPWRICTKRTSLKHIEQWHRNKNSTSQDKTRNWPRRNSSCLKIRWDKITYKPHDAANQSWAKANPQHKFSQDIRYWPHASNTVVPIWATKTLLAKKLNEKWHHMFEWSIKGIYDSSLFQTFPVNTGFYTTSMEKSDRMTFLWESPFPKWQ